MKKYLIFILLLLSGCSFFRESATLKPSEKTEKQAEAVFGEIGIVPQPASVRRGGGFFRLNKETALVAADDAARRAAQALNEILFEQCGLVLGIADKSAAANAITIATDADAAEKEGYSLRIEPAGIRIKGTASGMFYAVQSLAQLLPHEPAAEEIKIPAAEITDAPRFSYRGMHLDSARHFMPPEFVKKYIALMAQYKFNYFHWHLTDDQGWRVEIKKHPRLTEIGSKRRETVVAKNYSPYVGDAVPVEGFYTQEQIREIVAFAESKHVTIIPEIDLPGHSSAALAAYPEYGCRADHPYRVQTKWGGFPEIFCPTEQTFGFLEDVLTEVIELFPNSPYIHIGGDEVMTDHWRASAFVQELKKRENLSSEKEVEGWFFRRLATVLSARGKKAIGWDEIVEAGVETETTVMTWRSAENGLAAARAGHKVIMTPSDFTYFDHPQADPKTEPLGLGGQLSLQKVYLFDPVPPELQNSPEARNIIGGQGCVWTEFLKTPRAVEYMAFPRMIALSEVLWTRQRKKDFAEFSERLYRQFPRLDRLAVNYRIPEPSGLQDRMLRSEDKAIIDLKMPAQSGRIYYTLDGSEPHRGSTVYQAPFILDVEPNRTIELRAKIVSPNGRESAVYTARYFRQPPMLPPVAQIPPRGP